jgi:hypothetical protein
MLKEDYVLMVYLQDIVYAYGHCNAIQGMCKLDGILWFSLNKLV